MSESDTHAELVSALVRIADLESRLREADETLDAIRNGDVDAVVVGGPNGQQIYTLENADRPYRLLIEQMQECAVTLGADGAILYCNQRLSALTGIPRETLVGRHLQEFVIPNDRAAFDQLLTQGLNSRRSAEFSLIAAQGENVPVNMSVADLPVAEDMPYLLCGVITDLTRSRKRTDELAVANEQLATEIRERRRTEDKLQLALDAADMGNWDMDLLTGKTTRSARFDQIFGHADLDHWTIQTSGDLFVDDDRQAVAEAFAAAPVNGTVDLEKRIRRHNDRALRWVQIRGLTYYRDGQPIRIAGVVSDITDRRLIDEQLRQAQKMEAIGQLTGGVAHDFNNLLMVIAGSLDLLESRVGNDAKISRYLSTARHGVERGAKLNQQLLAFARRQDLRVESVDIGALLRSFENLLDRAIGETIAVTINDPDDLFYGRTDPHQLETAVLNLAINARDAMPQGGTLKISTHFRTIGSKSTSPNNATAGDYVVVTVSDTGSGMPQDVVAKVFEPFFTTKEVGKGTGLGLSQVYGFAKQSGGFVSIDSVVDEGTSVSIYLPRTEAPLSPNKADPASDEVKGQGTILVVEDDDDVREIASNMLRELGYMVFEANRGRSALTVIDSGAPIDLVFTDVIMPGDIGGIDLARAIKANHKNISVLLTSGYTAQRFQTDGIDEGLQILRKPYNRVDLSLAVKSAIGSGS
ncbi:PAS domain-containing sensor histidine kinase [Rhodanobacter sp. MP1X3]|uniref:hybrid sensor histidine kinase/response regulator n=1 Tax=Rhodanobacter sp. MP1X3 TaxID=2723086 RepID=UPI00161FA431|nr:PAS domain-containing sensor histidine kinase [Rhodanobacter sp. MP1X3]MBB6244469.1 PAS domain S-box-containing protein [Rhodanobacter sp. MP1X3]